MKNVPSYNEKAQKRKKKRNRNDKFGKHKESWTKTKLQEFRNIGCKERLFTATRYNNVNINRNGKTTKMGCNIRDTLSKKLKVIVHEKAILGNAFLHTSFSINPGRVS